MRPRQIRRCIAKIDRFLEANDEDVKVGEDAINHTFLILEWRKFKVRFDKVYPNREGVVKKKKDGIILNR